MCASSQDIDKSGTISTGEFAASNGWIRFVELHPEIVFPTNPNLKTFIGFMKSQKELTAALLLQQMEHDFVVEPVLAIARKLFEKLDVDSSGNIDLVSEGTALKDFSGKLFLEAYIARDHSDRDRITRRDQLRV